MPPRRVALLDHHLARVAVAHLDAHDVRVPADEPLEALGGAVVGEGDRHLVLVGQRRQPLPQQVHRALQLHQHRVRKVELLLQRVDVVDHDRRRAGRARRDRAQDTRHRRGGRHLAVRVDPLHRARRKVRHEDAEVPRSHPRQRVEDGELLEDLGRLAHRREEGGVVMLERRAVLVVHLDVGEPVGKRVPRDAAQLDAAAVVLVAGDALRERLHRPVVEQDDRAGLRHACRLVLALGRGPNEPDEISRGAVSVKRCAHSKERSKRAQLCKDGEAWCGVMRIVYGC